MTTRAHPARVRAAVAATRLVNALSRRFGAGSGSVAGGHAGLAIDPGLLEHLSAGRTVALVSGTNGKTTTTRLLAVAIEGALGRAATNATGSNMPTGHVTALASAPPGAPAVLEVDEGYLPQLVGTLGPDVTVLLNLSRDQLDRTNEVRMVANKWRRALAASPGTAVVANADDPLVTWAACAAAARVWVGAGLSWREDAVGCPACEGRIEFVAGPGAGWACRCGFARPRLDVSLEGDQVVLADGTRLTLTLALPGRFNRANAAMAAAAAAAMGVGWTTSLERIASVDEVAGRFAVVEVGGCNARVMLAKNPAGWRELLDVLCPGEGPVVVGINARVADGRDPSWLWDVPFERLRGRTVVATGERCRDLAVRLHYAEVAHRTIRDEVAAVRAAWLSTGAPSSGAPPRNGSAREVEFVGNYTAFTDLRARASGRGS
ncbi:MAG TPA: MurT ligase domain-containing protein [Acidimicrobiales bacterium]|nr:MurT ligase domain-containing protein [Acidimicrobiales bacterium]